MISKLLKMLIETTFMTQPMSMPTRKITRLTLHLELIPSMKFNLVQLPLQKTGEILLSTKMLIDKKSLIPKLNMLMRKTTSLIIQQKWLMLLLMIFSLKIWNKLMLMFTARVITRFTTKTLSGEKLLTAIPLRLLTQTCSNSLTHQIMLMTCQLIMRRELEMSKLTMPNE